MDIKGEHITVPLKEITIQVSGPVNQGAKSILIIGEDHAGRRWYVKSFNWQAFRGFDMLDISEVCTTAPITIEALPRKKVK